MHCKGCDEDDLGEEEICSRCKQCEWCCECDDEALFDADELGLDPEEDIADA